MQVHAPDIEEFIVMPQKFYYYKMGTILANGIVVFHPTFSAR